MFTVQRFPTFVVLYFELLITLENGKIEKIHFPGGEGGGGSLMFENIKFIP